MGNSAVTSLSDQISTVDANINKNSIETPATRLKFYLVAEPFFRDSSFGIRKVTLNGKNFEISVKLEDWNLGYFRQIQKWVFSSLKAGKTIILFIGETDMLSISRSVTMRHDLDCWEQRIKFWEKKFLKIREKYEIAKNGKIILVGLVRPGPNYEFLHAVTDRMNEVLLEMARRNPTFIGFRGFAYPRDYFEPRSKYFLEGQELFWNARGRRKVMKFLAEIIDTLAENHENPLPLCEWPLFNLPN